MGLDEFAKYKQVMQQQFLARGYPARIVQSADARATLKARETLF